MQGQLLADVDAPWNAMMAAAIIYVLPPIAPLFALRRYVPAGPTMGEVKRRVRQAASMTPRIRSPFGAIANSWNGSDGHSSPVP